MQLDKTRYIQLRNINAKELKVTSGNFVKGANIYVDKVKWELGISKDIKEDNGGFIFIHIKNLLEPESKSLKEVKGKVISDYQQKLDEDWIQELRLKYSFSVNKEILYSILR